MATPLTTAEQRRSLIIVMSCTSIVGITMGLTLPLLSLMLDSRNISSFLIGLSSASQSLAVIAIAPFASLLIRKYGVVRVIAGCIAVAVICLAALPTYINFYFWIPIRIILGASISLLFITGETWINHIATEDTRGRVIGLFGLSWSAGFAIGPTIIALVGIEGWQPFASAIGLIVLAAISLLFASKIAPTIEEKQTFVPIRQIFHIVPIAIMAAPMLGAIDAINDSLLPLYALRKGLSQSAAALVLTVLFLGTTLGHLPFGLLADRMDRWRLLCFSTLATIVLTGVVPFTLDNPRLVWPVVFLWGATLGGIWTVAIVLIGQYFSGSDLARVNALYTSFYSVGSIVGPTAGGILMDRWQPAAVPVFIGISLTAYLVFIFIYQLYRRP